MGILRTNEISGLETPTPVTGSVVFDGSGDYLSIADSNDWYFGSGDFTVELFFNAESLPSVSTLIAQTQSNDLDAETPFQIRTETTGLNAFVKESASIVGQCQTSTGLLSTNSWNHIAYTRDGSNMRLFVNGILRASASFSGTVDDGLGSLQIGSRAQANYFNGYISNLRILKGTALYTSDFTPPVHELQPIGDTVLLCCNNPDSAGAEATGKTIAVNGDAVASTFSPGLTRDFTYGTQFQGVAKFDTQGYFVPPSGTTEQQFPNFGAIESARGVYASGYFPFYNVIDYITISTTGNAQDFGDLVTATYGASGSSSSTRGLFAGGGTPAEAQTNAINYITIASTGNAQDFGDMTSSRNDHSSCSSNTRSVMAGGVSGPAAVNTIDYVTIASTSNAVDFGDLQVAAQFGGDAGCSSPTRGIFAARTSPDFGGIDYITIAALGNSIDFGTLSTNRLVSGASNSTRGLFAGGYVDNVIDYITIATTGNAQDFGDLTVARGLLAISSSSSRAVFGAGRFLSPATTDTNILDYVTITSTGNAIDFGDLIQGRHRLCACSNGHGGLG